MRFATLFLLAGLLGSQAPLQAQTSFPNNGVADERNGTLAFTNATLVTKPGTVLRNATLVVRNGRVVAAAAGLAAPKDAQVVDLQGKWIYPSFIDIYSDYGIAQPQRQQRDFNFFAPAQLSSNTKGAYGWNQAIHPETEGLRQFSMDEARAKQLRELGFGVVNTHVKDGIARGTGTVVSLATDRDNSAVIKDKSAAHYSFSKGTSTQSYPGSLMGSIALLRQTFLDAGWYASRPASEGVNISLQAWRDNQGLPQIFDIVERGTDHTTKWNALRADRVGDEFGVQFILKASGYEYQRMADMKATNAAFVLPLNFPAAIDAEDPNDLRFVSLADMKHWELAPGQPSAFEKQQIPFALTTADLRDAKQFMPMLRKALDYGLSEQKALEALTTEPARLLKIADQVGSLEPGKWANFLIANGPIFQEKTTVFYNYVQGIRYAVKDDGFQNMDGRYKLTVQGPGGTRSYNLTLQNSQAQVVAGADSLKARYTSDGRLVKLNFAETPKGRQPLRLSGAVVGNTLEGNGLDSAGNSVLFTATYEGPATQKSDSSRRKPPTDLGQVLYPFNGFGRTEPARRETIFIRNATVWTSEYQDSVLLNTDVVLSNGKITQLGKGIAQPSGARLIDGTGKFLTAGIIDEHSHIAASSINEGGQSVTSEVRIGDNLNPDDVNIYRQLSGGVTTSHILHGSANTIGGQTQLIKLRWGASDEALKFEGADGFIKFALGENVKRSPAQVNNRFPDSRMGVEQVLTDAFTRARDYEAGLRKATEGKALSGFRRDLELDALVEILNKKRFITCHSYVQSEINAAMKVGERFGFPFNTFTHILEGYKVADKMKAHGAAASTFSDWWNYKMEVVDAIAYNAAIMQRVGLNVAINSDDAEMARRLNQEAAKTVKYGGLSEQQAWRMVTINPANMMHVGNRTGSIKVGKDADVVLWSDNPLSIYAQPLYTIVDGTVQFDRLGEDLQRRNFIRNERNRLARKMMGEKRSGGPTAPASATLQEMYHCMDHFHKHGILVVDMQ